MKTHPLTELANLILAASKVREDSWNTEGEYYEVPLNECVQLVTGGGKEEYFTPVHFQLLCGWNDSIKWAEDFLAKQEAKKNSPKVKRRRRRRMWTSDVSS